MKNKLKHLEMIESIIERMAKNSFLLKGWTITLIVALFALADKQYEQKYILVAFVPIVLFWFLDSYYLYVERKFKKLYDFVRLQEEKSIDFNMDIKSFEVCFLKCVFSVSESMFYFPVIVSITVLIWLLDIV